jgi:hypothetical protein
VGQRANLVVIERGKRTLYYDHWCANRLDVELFWGPRLALEFVRQRDPVEEPDGWLDTIWCEGAAILDLDRTTLLWFGGEDILYDIPLRRAQLRLMRIPWQGWAIQWADEGILALADELRLPRSSFVAHPDDDTAEQLTLNEDYPEDNCVVTSLLREDGELLVGRLCGDEDGLRAGTKLIDTISAHSSADPLNWEGDFPRGGVHIDCARRTLDTWWTDVTPELVERTAAAWSGWTVRWHRDRYEEHVALTAGKLVLSSAPDLQGRVLKRLEANLAHDARNPARDLWPRMGANTQLNPATNAVRGSVGDEAEKRSLLASLAPASKR